MCYVVVDMGVALSEDSLALQYFSDMNNYADKVLKGILTHFGNHTIM